MREIMLTKGLMALVDDDKYDSVNQHPWCVKYSPHNRRYYAIRNIYPAGEKGKNHIIYMHRAILNAPKGTIVDHINGNTLDNRLSNLRFVTNRENIQNQQNRHSSIYPGVTRDFRRNKWRSKIKIDGKGQNIGSFTSEVDAFKAYLTVCVQNNIPINLMVEKFNITPEPLEILKARQEQKPRVTKCKECKYLMRFPYRNNTYRSYCKNVNEFIPRHYGYSPQWCPLRERFDNAETL